MEIDEENGLEDGVEESPPKKFFVDESGRPLKFSISAKQPSCYVNLLKKHGGEVNNIAGTPDVIYLAPSGFCPPVNSTVSYYSLAFITDCVHAQKLLDRSSYLVPKGQRARISDDESDGPRPSISGSDRGRQKFSMEEDMAILHFVYNGQLDDLLYRKIPNREWDKLAKQNVFGDHSGDTVRTRYQRVLMLDIDKYAEVYKKRLKEGHFGSEGSDVQRAVEIAEDAFESRGRHKFSIDEDMAILHFVYNGQPGDLHYVKIPNREWEKAAKQNVFGDRSGDSARTRYQRVLMLDIEKHAEVYKKLLKEGYFGSEGSDVQGAVEIAEDAFEAEEDSQMACSQSQIGPPVTSQTAKKPLLTSTPFVPENNISSLVIADVVGEVPLEIMECSESSSGSEVVVRRRKSDDGPSMAVSDSQSEVKRLRRSPRKFTASLQSRSKETVVPSKQSQLETEGGGQQLNAKATALAQFLSTADNLDQESTQTVIQLAQSLTDPRQHRTRSGDNGGFQKQPDAMLTSRECPISSPEKASSKNKPAEKNMVATPKKASLATVQISKESTLAATADNSIQKSIYYNLVETLASRYCIEPVHIVALLGRAGGSVAKVIAHVERNNCPLPGQPCFTACHNTSSEKEN